jgi:hypothetical protein
MTRKVFAAALRGFTRRHPFRPFLIEFTSGDRLLVTHPEAVRFEGDVLVYLSPDRRYRLFDNESVCQLLDLPPAASPS